MPPNDWRERRAVLRHVRPDALVRAPPSLSKIQLRDLADLKVEIDAVRSIIDYINPQAPPPTFVPFMRLVEIDFECRIFVNMLRAVAKMTYDSLSLADIYSNPRYWTIRRLSYGEKSVPH